MHNFGLSASEVKLQTSRVGHFCSQMLQLLGLVTQMCGNKLAVTNECDCEDHAALICGADPQNISEPPNDSGYFCSDPVSTFIFTT